MNQTELVAAREAFISEGIESDQVRAETLRAWRRSRAAGAAHESAPVMAVSEVDPVSALRRAAEPVIAALMHTLGTAEYAMMITDRDARIVGRWTSGTSMRLMLDKMGVLTGASFEEASVGSTGLGTVLEDRSTAVVDGAEHYNRRFDPVIAVGAPIVHPGTGCVEGVLDLVCPTGAPAEIMIALTERAAKDTGERLLSGYAAEDRALLDAFLRVDRRGPKRPIMAMNGRLVMANQHAESILGTSSHGMLWQRVVQTLADGNEAMRLPADGGEIEVQIRSVESAGSKAGALLQFNLNRERARSQAPPRDAAADIVVDVLKCLPGHSVIWRAALGSAARAVVSREHVLLVGNVGVGKSAVARALCDAGSMSNSGGTRIIEDLHAFSRADLALLRRQLRDPDAAPMIATATAPLSDEIRAMFANVVEIPDLARRQEDIGAIVTAIVSRKTSGATVDAEVLRELGNRKWTGNVDQLERVVLAAIEKSAGSRIGMVDIPTAAEINRPRRQLNYLEVVERDAIVQVLQSADGNKRKTAEILGVSRATLYRKLSSLGIE